MQKKLEDIVNAAKIKELLKKKEEEEKKKSNLVFVLAIVGAVALVALIAVAVFKYLQPDYIDDDDYDFDDFEDDDFIELDSDNKTADSDDDTVNA